MTKMSITKMKCPFLNFYCGDYKHCNKCSIYKQIKEEHNIKINRYGI